MTNDLRDYFNSVALQRPAEGELDRAIGATRALRPRPAWQAQLAQVVSALGWPASAALRYAVWLALLLLMLALLSSALPVWAGHRPRRSGPFEGRWRALDPDGSDLTLVVSADESPDVRFEDNYASACANKGDSVTQWVSVGQGTVDGKSMSVHYPSGGGCASWHIDAISTCSYTTRARTRSPTTWATSGGVQRRSGFGVTWRTPRRASRG